MLAPFVVEYVFCGDEYACHLCICPRCQLFFSDVRFDDAEINRLYKDYRGERYCQIREKHEPSYKSDINANFGKSKAIATRKAFIETIITHHPTKRGESVIDYGGDRGQLIPDSLTPVKRFVYDISGVSPIAGVTSLDNPASHAPYDLVMCCGVLEHVSFPRIMLQDLSSLVAPGGALYIEVPAGIPTRRYFDITIGKSRLARNWKPIFHEHINYFTKSSLMNTLLLSGFTPLFTHIAILDLGWSLSPTIGCLAIPSNASMSATCGLLSVFMEGIEYGIKRHILPVFSSSESV
jgi:hypothetical protein